MNDPHDPNETDAGTNGGDETGAVPPLPIDSLDVGLAAAFGRAAPRSSLGSKNTVMLKDAEGESGLVVRPNSDAMPTKDEAGDRYRLDGEIARGGMGAVLRGRDVDLGRDLAVKVLLEKYANRPDVARRFIEEAQIGGQLQHPGVVPVYDIGKFGDRPFFTMKLVKGHTLAAILGERSDPSVDRPRLLGIALQVSQAMAYAHAKGVIHRDLKPANIMVGAFGEVQVMDWGLAKVLAEGAVHDEERASRAHQEPQETVIRTARSTGSQGTFDTEAGSVLGTPAYMPPEQASGDIANLDRRTDVFGLGAILCEILTGMPPYLGRSAEEIRRKAANGDLADAMARLGACCADAELIALTKLCLSPEAIDRPKDAQAVADGLSAYLDGVQERLQTAERERAVALARAEEEVKTRQVAEEKAAEQRKRRRVQSQLAASMAALLLGGVAVAWWQTEQANARRETELRRQLADEQRAVGDAARLARNGEAVTSLLARCEEALKAGDAAKATVALEAAKKRYSEGGAEKGADRLKRLDGDLALLCDLDAVDQFRSTPIVGEVPDAASVAMRTRDALKRFGAEPDEVTAAVAAARVSASVVRDRIVAAVDRLLQRTRTSGVRALLRQVDADPYRDAVRDAVLANDAAKLVGLAGQKAALEQPPEFTAFLGESPAIPVERRLQLLQAAVTRRPGDLSLLIILGQISSGTNERLRWLQAAVAVGPVNLAALNNLGLALKDKGQLDEAIACYQKAIDLDPKFAATRSNLGVALQMRGQLDEALGCFKKAIELDPKNAASHNNLGAALYIKGQLDEAFACFKKAVELDPKNANAHTGLGCALMAKGQLDEAIACFKKAIALDPKLAMAHYNLGGALMAKGELDEAITCFREAIELDPKNSKNHYSLGLSLQQKGQLAEAIACYQKAIALDPKNAAAHTNLGGALMAKGQMDEAISHFKKAIQLDPKNAAAHTNLGSTLMAKGQLDEAIACYQKVIALDPKNAEAYCNLGHVLANQGRYAVSLAAYKRGQELGSTQPGWRHPSADWVRLAEVKAALEAKLPAFLKGDFQPSGTEERLSLAGICQVKNLNRTAAGLYGAAFAADPKLADDLKSGHRYNAACCAALAAAGQGEDAARLDDKERTSLRKKALDWLRADLAVRTQRLESAQPADRAAALQALRHWQIDTDLDGTRDTSALARLPADEQKACTQLWADVAALLNEAGAKEPRPAS